MANPWWEAIYTVITGGGRSAYVSGSGIRVVQAASAAAAASQTEADVQGAKVGNVNGPYATQALAQQQAQSDQQAQQGGTETSSGGTGTSNNPKLNVSLGNFLGDLTSSALWIRVAEGVLGLALILVAVAELFKGTAVSSAIKKTPVLFA